MEHLKDILDKVKSRGLFNSIERFTYKPYDMDYALKVVNGLGRSRTPKFKIDEENRFTYENLIRWVHGDSEMLCLNPETREPMKGRLNAGIYIAGNTGTGKSWALEIMTAYSLIDNVQFKVDDNNCCLHWENVRADSICEEFAREGSVERFKRRCILGIQDLGAEPVESLYMGNRLEVLRSVLESRGDRTDRITLITSNFPISHVKLAERYGDRVASRLAEMCNYFEIRGRDRRKIELSNGEQRKDLPPNKASNARR